jgi:hypothetical protein
MTEDGEQTEKEGRSSGHQANRAQEIRKTGYQKGFI